MIELLVRHLVVLALAGICSLALRRRSAALRHALWTIALVLCLLLPLLQRVPILLPVAPSPPAIVEREASRAGIEGFVVTLDAPLAPTPVAPAPRFPWATLAWGVYLAVAVGLVLRWTIGWGLAARLAHRGKRLGAARGVPVVAVEGVGPLTFGWPRGVIVVPSSEFALDKLVLRHEVAHVKRADFVWQGVGALACALWWFSPAVWLAARALRREAERACDDLVLSQGVSAPDYADCLLEVASMKPLSLPLAASLVPLARRGDLAHRIAALLAPNRDRRSARPLAIVGLTAVLLPAGLTVSRPVLADGSGAAESPVAASLRSAARALPRLQTPAVPSLVRSLPSPKAPSAPSPFAVAIPTPPASELQPASSAELAPPAAQVAPISSTPNAPAPPDSVAPVAPAVPATPQVSGSLKGKKIVLDPGHGGTDPGALGVISSPFRGSVRPPQEKDVNLNIARKAADALRKEGAIVTLTRDSDTFVDLNKRAAFSAGQDLFLSIHVDSGKTSNAKQGFKFNVFYHGKLGDTPPLAPKSMAEALLKSVFADFEPVASQTAPSPKSDSASFSAPLTLDAASSAPTAFVTPDARISPLGFAVLRNAKCPAYLIDFGNMSNESDLVKLRDSAFLDKLAQGLVAGAKAVLAGGTANVVVRPAGEIRTERILLRFMDADSLAKQLEPVIAKGGSLAGASVQPNPKDNSLVVQGTPEAVANLKQLVRMLDQKPRIVMVKITKIAEEVEGKLGDSFAISTANNSKGELTIGEKRYGVVPHLNGDGKTVSLMLILGSEKPFSKKIPLGEETKLETPFGVFLVAVTEATDGATDPK